ncbi:MAG: cupin domain-containing protein [Acidimicrobiales bacterium]
MEPVNHRRHEGRFRWDAVELLEYKPAADHGGDTFREVTRQVLLEHGGLACQLRYFEVGAGGHSTLERHQHVHGVLVLNGSGRVLVGHEVLDLQLHDLITIPPLTWHQFRAHEQAPLGFLCLVNIERDRPMLPSADELAQLQANPELAAFIRV